MNTFYIFLLLFGYFQIANGCGGLLEGFGFSEDELAEIEDPKLYLRTLSRKTDAQSEQITRMKKKGLTVKNMKEGEDSEEEGPLDPLEKACVSIKCNFEGETICRWISIGTIAKPGRVDQTGLDEMLSALGEGDLTGALSGITGGGGGLASLFGGGGDIFGNLLGKFGDVSLGDIGRGLAGEVIPYSALGENVFVPSDFVKPVIPPAFSWQPEASFFPQKRKKRQLDKLMKGDIGDKKLSWFSYNGALGESCERCVPGADEGDYYAGAYLMRNEYAIMTGFVNMTDYGPFDVSFLAYESGKKLQLRFCCDTPDFCPYETQYSVSDEDFEWKYQEASCPAGTEKVLFICDNFGRKNASCGVDDVRIMGVECSQKFTPKEANPNFMLENGLGIFKGGSLAEILTGKKIDLPAQESHLGNIMTGFGGKKPILRPEQETTTAVYDEATDDYNDYYGNYDDDNGNGNGNDNYNYYDDDDDDDDDKGSGNKRKNKNDNKSKNKNDNKRKINDDRSRKLRNRAAAKAKRARALKARRARRAKAKRLRS